MEQLLSSIPFPLSVLECTKVMQISFEKIVSSKQQRGGARLHRNLMVLHVLQKARDQARQRLIHSFFNRFKNENESGCFSAFSLISPASDEEEEESSFSNDQEKPPLIYVHDDPLPLEADQSEYSSSTTTEETNEFLNHEQIQNQNEENFSPSDFYCETTEELTETLEISSVSAELYSSKENRSIFGQGAFDFYCRRKFFCSSLKIFNIQNYKFKFVMKKFLNDLKFLTAVK